MSALERWIGGQGFPRNGAAKRSPETVFGTVDDSHRSCNVGTIGNLSLLLLVGFAYRI